MVGAWRQLLYGGADQQAALAPAQGPGHYCKPEENAENVNGACMNWSLVALAPEPGLLSPS